MENINELKGINTGNKAQMIVDEIIPKKNLCGKMVKKENAYEVWTNIVPIFDCDVNTWTWYVLKKYQSPENEAKNEYARWYCLVETPIVPEGEYGDTYVKDITTYGKRIK